MIDILLIATGAFVGALARYLLSWWRATGGSTFPYGILAANAIGSLVLGLIIVGSSQSALLLGGVGFCGALTTFSTFALDTLVLEREGRRSAAVANVVISVGACLASVALGLALGQAAGLS